MASAQQDGSVPQLQHKESVAAVVAANQAFLSKLYPALSQAAGGGNGNLVVSPFSLSSVLAMLHAGAAGETEREIRQGMALPDQDQAILDGYADVGAVTRSKFADLFSTSQTITHFQL